MNNNIDSLVLNYINGDKEILNLMDKLNLMTNAIEIEPEFYIKGLSFMIGFYKKNSPLPLQVSSIVIPIFDLFKETNKDYMQTLIEYELYYHNVIIENKKTKSNCEEANNFAFKYDVEFIEKKSKQKLSDVQLMTIFFIAQIIYKKHFNKYYKNEVMLPKDNIIIKYAIRKEKIENQEHRERIEFLLNNIIDIMKADIE